MVVALAQAALGGWPTGLPGGSQGRRVVGAEQRVSLQQVNPFADRGLGTKRPGTPRGSATVLQTQGGTGLRVALALFEVLHGR